MSRAGAVIGLVAAMTAPVGMQAVPAGSYQAFFRSVAPAVEPPGTLEAGRRATAPAEVSVDGFVLDERPVSVGDFLAFVRAHPAWRRAKAPALFVDASYLRGWVDDLDPGPPAVRAAPVTEVSWFAAKAYCRAAGKRLPTVSEWEYAASDAPSERPRTTERILAWYGRPTPPVLPAAGAGPANRFGLRDLHGAIWEWTLDFNSALTTGDSRGGAGEDAGGLFCGAAGARAVNPDDSATFMRYAFRSSLEARYTLRNLGFRCARSRDALSKDGR
jgi:sulfatase modifying factor 1